MYRWRWHFWSVYVVLWTTALLFPVIPETGFEDVDEFISPHRYLLAKSVHVSAYAVMTLLTAFLNAPMRYRWLLVYFLMAHGTATGFCFTEYSAAALVKTIERALDLFSDKLEWMRLVRAGMNQDWSWRQSALQYVRVYERAMAKRRAAAAAPNLVSEGKMASS